jgi:hypothetical protein
LKGLEELEARKCLWLNEERVKRLVREAEELRWCDFRDCGREVWVGEGSGRTVGRTMAAS